MALGETNLHLLMTGYKQDLFSKLPSYFENSPQLRGEYHQISNPGNGNKVIESRMLTVQVSWIRRLEWGTFLLTVLKTVVRMVGFSNDSIGMGANSLDKPE